MTLVEWIAALGGTSGLLVALGHARRGYTLAAGWWRGRVAEDAGVRKKELEAEARVKQSEIIRDERIRLAEIEVDAKREERTEGRLWDRVEALEREAGGCKQQIAQQAAAHEEQRQRDRAACDERVAAVEQRQTRLARRVAERWRLDAPFDGVDDREDTGLHEVEAIARSTPLPPKEGA